MIIIIYIDYLTMSILELFLHTQWVLLTFGNKNIETLIYTYLSLKDKDTLKY